jgi:hypothetical protein
MTLPHPAFLALRAITARCAQHRGGPSMLAADRLIEMPGAAQASYEHQDRIS